MVSPILKCCNQSPAAKWNSTRIKDHASPLGWQKPKPPRTNHKPCRCCNNRRDHSPTAAEKMLDDKSARTEDKKHRQNRPSSPHLGPLLSILVCDFECHKRVCSLTKKAEPPPTRDVNRDCGTDSGNGGWLRRLVRPHGHALYHKSPSDALPHPK